jgi:hypothetical protein
MSCGTGECGCGCGDLLHIHVKPEVNSELALKIEGSEKADQVTDSSSKSAR